MSFVPFSIDLEMIVPPEAVNRAQFEDQQIESLARMFLEVRDTIKPIILRRISPISYQIIAGHLGYYAALKAEQIDPQFTAIQAYIATPELEPAIIKQYNFFALLGSNIVVSNALTSRDDLPSRNQAHDQIVTVAHSIDTDSIMQQVLAKINILESQMADLASRITDQQLHESKLESVIRQSIENCIKNIPPDTRIKPQKLSKLEYDVEKAKSLIEALNHLDILPLTEKLKQAGVATAKATAKKIWESRSVKPYDSIEDASSRKGSDGKRFLTDVTLKKILTNW